jgi:hypothetical protein
VTAPPFVCPHCGKEPNPDRNRYCNHCGGSFIRPGTEPPPPPEPVATVEVRNYPGRTQAEAAQLFRRDAAFLASRNYRPTGQSWAEGRPGSGRVLTLGLFASSLRPAGYLTVTYQKQEAPDEKLCPRCAETVKARAFVCRYCGHEFQPEDSDIA